MLSADRRLQEASQALALAFNISRIEEAIYRLDAGEGLAPSERSYFERVADLFADAKMGYARVEAVLTGKATVEQAATHQQLRALRMILPVIQAQVGQQLSAVELLADLASVALTLSSGIAVPAAQRERFLAVLSRLASHASGEGVNALQSTPPAVTFPPLPRSSD